MDTTHPHKEDPLEALLRRSDELHETLLRRLEGSEFDSSPGGQACFGMCSVAMEHSLGLRALMAAGLPTSATALMRLQFEALTRVMWLLYAARDREISKLQAPLTLESEQSAKHLPSVTQMIEQIGTQVGTRAPAAAHAMPLHFKEVSRKAMNSFVHGGIHPLRRHAEGFPVPLALQVLRSSNGLLTMTAMTLAVLTGDESITRPIRQMQLTLSTVAEVQVDVSGVGEDSKFDEQETDSTHSRDRVPVAVLPNGERDLGAASMRAHEVVSCLHMAVDGVTAQIGAPDDERNEIQTGQYSGRVHDPFGALRLAPDSRAGLHRNQSPEV